MQNRLAVSLYRTGLTRAGVLQIVRFAVVGADRTAVSLGLYLILLIVAPICCYRQRKIRLFRQVVLAYLFSLYGRMRGQLPSKPDFARNGRRTHRHSPNHFIPCRDQDTGLRRHRIRATRNPNWLGLTNALLLAESFQC